jgi:hypothetical protein
MPLFIAHMCDGLGARSWARQYCMPANMGDVKRTGGPFDTHPNRQPFFPNLFDAAIFKLAVPQISKPGT